MKMQILNCIIIFHTCMCSLSKDGHAIIQFAFSLLPDVYVCIKMKMSVLFNM